LLSSTLSSCWWPPKLVLCSALTSKIPMRSPTLLWTSVIVSAQTANAGELLLPFFVGIPVDCESRFTLLFYSLSSVALHPKFSENRWIYLFYTYNRGDTRCLIDVAEGPVNRCSRFTMDENFQVLLETEKVLFTNHGAVSAIHNAGE